MKKICILIVTAIIIITMIFWGNNNKVYSITGKNFTPTNSNAGDVIFNKVGHYAFASAGNNNCYKGTQQGVGVKKLMYPPKDAEGKDEEWYTELVSQLSEKGITIDNISGSKLDIKGGKIEKAFLSWMAPYYKGRTDYYKGGRILIIKPDHDYVIATINEDLNYGNFEITQYLKESENNGNSAEGWYYVSFLDLSNASPQCAWAISSVYTQEDLELRYVKLINVNVSLSGNGSRKKTAEFDFNSAYTLKDNVQLYGVIMSAGAEAWTNLPNTSDKTEAKLIDRSTGTISYMTLEEREYNGNIVFKGRDKNDFASGIFSTVRNHDGVSGTEGGELDIFNETVSKDFFDNKEIIGYKFTKIGANQYNPSIVGIAKEVEDANLTIETKIEKAKKDEKEKNAIIVGDKIKVTTKITNIPTDEKKETAYKNVITLDLKDKLSNPDMENIIIKINGEVNNEVIGTYNKETNTITFTPVDEINKNTTVTIIYDAYVNENFTKDDTTIEETASVKYYPFDFENLDESSKEEFESITAEVSATAEEDEEYEKATINVLHKDIIYKDETTNEHLLTANNKPVTITDYVGEAYTTETLQLDNYELVQEREPENKNGVIARGGDTVIYYYKLKEPKVESEITKNISKIGNSTENLVDLNSANDKINYKINYSATIKDYIGDGVLTITDTLPYEVDKNKSNLSGGTLSEDNKKITWTFQYKNINTYQNVNNEFIITLPSEIEISIQYKYVDGIVNPILENKVKGSFECTSILDDEPCDKVFVCEDTEQANIKSKYKIEYYYDMPNGEGYKIDEEKTYISNNSIIIGTKITTYEDKIKDGYKLKEVQNLPMEINSKEEENIIKVYYERKEAKVIVKYLDENGKELEESTIINGKIFDQYETKKKGIDGYKLKKKPDNAKGEMTEEEVTVVYIYEKNKTIITGDLSNINVYQIGLIVSIVLIISLIIKKKIK